MATNNIDMNVWVTQQALTTELGLKNVQVVHNWVRRGKIQSKRIEGSRLVLVDKTTVIGDLRKVNKSV